MQRAFSVTLKIFLYITILSFVTLAQVPRDGLVAWYPFTGNASDSSGNGQHGIATKVEPVPDRFAYEDCAYQFIGTDSSKIVANGSPSLPEGNNPKSISLWFRNTGYTPAGYAIMAGFGEANVHNRSFQLGYRYNKPLPDYRYNRQYMKNTKILYDESIEEDCQYDTLFVVNGYGGQYDWDTDVLYSPYNDGNWHHFVGTYNGTETAIYLDGIRKASTTKYSFLTGTNRIVIGNETDNMTWPFRGFLDDVAIYNRVLTQSEISSIYTYNGYSINLNEIANTTNPRPLFSWHTNADISNFIMYIDTTNTFVNPLFADSVSDTVYQPTSDLPVGEIFWKVAAHIGLFSKIASFYILDPKVPVTIPFIPWYSYNKKPTFRWHKVVNATSYSINISMDINFTKIVITNPVSDTAFTPSADLPVDTLFWRVRSDLSSTYSEVSKIVILSDSIPELYRFDGMKVDTYKPTFKWKPVVGAVSYEIKIDSVSTFPSPIVLTPVSDTTYQLPVEIIEKELFWQVSSNIMPGIFSPYDSVTTRDSTGIIAKPILQKDNDIFIQTVSNSLIRIMVCFSKPYKNAIIIVYTITGRQIKNISRMFVDNNQSVLWDCTDNNGKKIPAGVYIIQAKTEEQNAVAKVHLLL